MAVAGLLTAQLLRIDLTIGAASILGLIIAVRLAAFVRVGMYRSVLRYSGLHTLTIASLGVALGTGVGVAATFFLHWENAAGLGPRMLILEGLASLAVCGATRVIARIVLERQVCAVQQRALIYGAGDLGELTMRNLRRLGSYRPVGFLDDDRHKHRAIIHGRSVLGGLKDLDAVVAACVDLRTGAELSERLMVKRRKAERDMAVMFMVDMSGSTKGWVNDAEREALVLLAEALEILGDRYAIYGFSGVTRQRCEIYRIKRFDEPYSDAVRGRIAGIKAQDYTRMGAAIRHLSTLLDRVDARTKLLVTLSDGKPDDYSDHYRGEYGIEDTRQALAEAHRRGIHPFCVTIDKEARDYLPHLYGAVNWTLVEDVTRLPLKVAEIYRRLTT